MMTVQSGYCQFSLPSTWRAQRERIKEASRPVRESACSDSQVFCPAAQGPAQPAADWNAEAHLGPVDQRVGNVARDQATQQPFRLAVA